MEYLIIWIICGIGAVILGNSKGASGISLFTGFLLGPLGLLSAITFKSNVKECPYCKEKIKKAAVVCPHCQKELSSIQK